MGCEHDAEPPRAQATTEHRGQKKTKLNQRFFLRKKIQFQLALVISNTAMRVNMSEEDGVRSVLWPTASSFLSSPSFARNRRHETVLPPEWNEVTIAFSVYRRNLSRGITPAT